MSTIIGHDIDGRPLRVGDLCVLVWVNFPDNLCGETVLITGSEECYGYSMIRYNGFFLVVGEQLKKTYGDHLPATESFTELMSKLTGVPA